jgi:uncharacterized protein (DUF58 family)
MWRDLPIIIRQNVRQRTGYRLLSDKVSDRGFDICGVRESEAGDSPRSLSRKHYVRTGKEIVLEKRPLRNAAVLFLLDASASEQVGADCTKYEASLKLLRHIAWACLWQGNTTQVIAFTTRVEWESGIIHDSRALEDVMDQLSDLKPEFSGTDHRDVLDLALSITGRADHPADLVFIISDLISPRPREGFFRDLMDLGDEADVIALIVRDRIETEMPLLNGGLMVRDSETGEMFWASDSTGTDPTEELSQCDIDTCTLMTSQTEEEWFGILSDFFITRMQGDRR